MAEKGKYPLKIIQPMFGRAGSTSLAEAANILGCGPSWHTVSNGYNKNERGFKKWIELRIDSKIANGIITAADLDEWLQCIECQSIFDAPIAYAYATFIEFYPNAKVIAVIRDYEQLRASQRKIFNNILDTWWFRWVICSISTSAHYLRYTFLDLAFANHGWSYEEFMYCDAKRYKQINDQNLERLKALVPSQQLLIFDVSKDGWPKLCEFLNKPIPDQPFPHRNKTESHNFVRKTVAILALFLVVLCVAVMYIV